jgi:hypothetical protein
MRSPSDIDHRSSAIMSAYAIACIVAGLALSVSFIPQNYQEPGALFWSGLSLAVGLLIIPLVRTRLYDIRTAIHPENFVLLGLVYWILLDVLQTTYPLRGVDIHDVELAFCAIALMAIGLWIGVAMRPWNVPRPLMNAVTTQLEAGEIFLLILVCSALSSFYYFYESDFDPDLILNGLLAGRWEAPWSRGQFGDWRAFLEHLSYFGYIIPSLTVLLALSSPPPRWFRPRVIIGICLSLLFIAFLLQSGSRRNIGVVVGGALLTWIATLPRLKLKAVLVGGVTLVLMLYALQGVLYVRKMGLEAALEGKISESETKSYFHVDDNFLRLSQIISLMPDHFEYAGYHPVLYILLRPIPRVLWPGKPIDPGYNLPSMISLRGSGNTSLSTSIVGELYASWGLVAVFLGGMFFGKLASMWNRILFQTSSLNSRAFYGLGIMVLFAGIRSMQELLLMSYGVLGWALLSNVFRRFRGRPRASSIS